MLTGDDTTGVVEAGIDAGWITVENRDYHYLSQSEIAGDKRIYQHLSWENCQATALACQLLLGDLV